MLQINKDGSTKRPTIQIIGENLDEVNQWRWFFENRGAIEVAPEAEEIGNVFVCEFSCDMEKLIKCYSISAPVTYPAGGKLRAIQRHTVETFIHTYALARIAALPALVPYLYNRTAIQTYAMGVTDGLSHATV